MALFSRLVYSRDAQLAAIAAKGLKEVRYHLRFSRGWLERLGNGTDYSAQLMQQAVNSLWRFTGELFMADELDISLSEQGIAVDPRELAAEWQTTVHTALLDACRSLKKRRSVAAASRGYTANISARCWQRCSIYSGRIPASSGSRRWLCNVSPQSHPRRFVPSGDC